MKRVTSKLSSANLGKFVKSRSLTRTTVSSITTKRSLWRRPLLPGLSLSKAKNSRSTSASRTIETKWIMPVEGEGGVEDTAMQVVAKAREWIPEQKEENVEVEIQGWSDHKQIRHYINQQQLVHCQSSRGWPHFGNVDSGGPSLHVADAVGETRNFCFISTVMKV
mmetsp:Transcript_6751/g.13409  ORF Transcript_6751/g.13409 Transcript_6751/m.13409 type:complete len:165 (-) Transcript_6751:132-626(-)